MLNKLTFAHIMLWCPAAGFLGARALQGPPQTPKYGHSEVIRGPLINSECARGNGVIKANVWQHANTRIHSESGGKAFLFSSPIPMQSPPAPVYYVLLCLLLVNKVCWNEHATRARVYIFWGELYLCKR